MDYGSEFSSFSHYSVDALVALQGTIDISRRTEAVLTTKLLSDVTIPEPRDTRECPAEVREHPTQEMCPQAPTGYEMISPKLPRSFHIQLNILQGPKLLSLDVFRTMGKTASDVENLPWPCLCLGFAACVFCAGATVRWSMGAACER